MNENKYIEELALQIKEEFDMLNKTLTFQEYINEIVKNPYKQLRTAYQYVRDSILYFGTEKVKDCGKELTKYKLFEDPFFNGRERVVGQLRPIEELVRNLDACAKQQSDESLLILTGPPGTAKSKILTLIEKGMEAYSKTEEGVVYTINWVIDGKARGFFGFGEKEMKVKNPTYCCQLRDHPITLIPIEKRRFVLETIINTHLKELSENSEEYELLTNMPIPQKLLEAELCRNCQSIRNDFLEKHKGDWNEVIKQVRIKRFFYSLSTGQGIVEVDAGVNLQADSVSLSLNAGQEALLNILGGLELFRFKGKSAYANRGLINYHEIYENSTQSLLYLLSAVEENNVDFGDVTQKIDYVIIGTTNIEQLEIFKQNPCNKHFLDRSKEIKVPYILNYKEESKIYEPNVIEIIKCKHMAPHTIDMGALFLVLTRITTFDMNEYFKGKLEALIRRATILSRAGVDKDNINKEITDKKEKLNDIKELIEDIEKDPLNKAFIYSGDLLFLPNSFKKIITDELLQSIKERHKDEEGINFGISPRRFKNSILDALSKQEDACINPFILLDKLEEEISSQKTFYDSEKSARELIAGIKKHYLINILLPEVEKAVFGVNEKELRRAALKYIKNLGDVMRKNLKSLGGLPSEIEKEGFKQDMTPEQYVEYVEQKELGIENTEEYRKNIINKINSAPGEKPDLNKGLEEILPDFERAFCRESKESFKREEYLYAIELLKNEFKPFEKIEYNDVRSEIKKQFEKTLKNVISAIDVLRKNSINKPDDEMYGYCNDCAIEVIKFILKDPVTQKRFDQLS